jgi:hypothetical protein
MYLTAGVLMCLLLPGIMTAAIEAATAVIEQGVQTVEGIVERAWEKLKEWWQHEPERPRPVPCIPGLMPFCTPGDDDQADFYRGSRLGEPVSFEPQPNEYRVDPATGFVRPTHGVSVFDNRESVASRGFVPHRVDMSSVSSDLQIIQRGEDPHHYEITPRPGTSLLPEDYAALLRRIRTLDLRDGRLRLRPAFPAGL